MKGAGLAILFITAFLACSTHVALAQAVPDTSLNRVVPDALPERNTAILASPAPDQVAHDSLEKVIQPFQPNPKKSALYSAILPGAGQLYNRQYWKLPIIYAGVGVAVYFLIDNSNKYQEYRRAYINRINNPGYRDRFTDLHYTPGNLQTLQNAQKKYLDMTTLFTALGYTIQVLDALAFAHLKNFDVSQNISLHIQPVALPNGDPGIGLVMNLK